MKQITVPFLANLAKILSGATVRWVDCEPDICQRVYFANHTSHLDALVLWVVSVIDVVVLAVEPLGVPETGVDAAPVFRGDRLTAQRCDQGEDEFCHGVALPCVMVFAVHLGDSSDNSNLGVSYVPNSET